MTSKLPSEQPAQPPVRRVKSERPLVRRFSVAEYYKIAEIGLFEKERVELINGEVVRMSPLGLKHSDAIVLIGNILRRSLGPEFAIRPQLPLRTGKRTEVEPDFAIIRGSGLSSGGMHPTTAELIIEVAESSLSSDRTTKAVIYAKAGVPEYWLVDLAHHRLEVRRDPKPLDEKKRKYAYAQMTTYLPGESVSPLVVPELKLAVSEMLP